MTVRDLIAKLQAFDQDLSVCLTDGNEYWGPSELATETIAVTEGKYYSADPSLPLSVPIKGKFICIG